MASATAAWEQLIARPRFYRTRRERLPTAYPAMTIGDVGAAGGALALMLAADSFLNDYAPGPTVACEVASENGLAGGSGHGPHDPAIECERSSRPVSLVDALEFRSRRGIGVCCANRPAARRV